MNANRFDARIRLLAGAPTRRSALGSVLGAGLAALLPRLGGEGAAARKKGRKRNKKCKRGQKKCGGKCANLTTDSANCGFCGNACPSGQCRGGFCICSGQEDCASLDNCECGLAINGAIVCAGALTTTSCTDNSGCPPRSVCRQAIGGSFCGAPCPS